MQGAVSIYAPRNFRFAPGYCYAGVTMIEGILVRFYDPVMSRIAARLGDAGARPRSLMVLAFVYAAAATAFVAAHSGWFALVFVVLSRLTIEIANVHEHHKPLHVVELADLVLYAALAFGFAVADPDSALAATFLLLGIVIFAICLSQAQVKSTADRSMRTLVGLGLFVAAAVACIKPETFDLIAYAAGLVCFLSAGMLAATIAIRSA